MIKQSFNYQQSKRKVNIKNLFCFFIFPLTTIIILLATISSFKNSQFINKFYIVEIGKFSSYMDAQNYIKTSTQTEQKFNIFFDEKYRVFSSIHTSKKDAKNEVAKLKKIHSKAKVYSLEILSFKEQKILTKKENSIVENFTFSVMKSIVVSSKNYTLFCSSKMEYKKLDFHLKSYYKNFIDSYSNLLKLYNRFRNFTATRKYVDRIKSSIENLKNFSTEDLQTHFHFELINLAINLNHFLSCF